MNINKIAGFPATKRIFLSLLAGIAVLSHSKTPAMIVITDHNQQVCTPHTGGWFKQTIMTLVSSI